MKREDLKALGLTDEQIEKVMAENGKDIEKHKSTADNAKTELDNLKAQITEANKQIDSFKAMKVEDIQKAANDYKTKFEQAQADATKQVAQLKFDHALEGALVTAKAKNAKAVKALLDIPNLKLKEDDGSIIGLDEQLKKVKEANAFLFEEEQPLPKVVLNSNNQSVLTDPVVLAARKAAGLPVGEK
jgi:predicted ester cyclase